jgi:exopolysaccharide biosynthesis protein
VQEETATPQPPQPTAQPDQDLSANGDFSATFPAYDTGTGAMLSHQDDNLRIAINKVQTDDVTYFVADVWVKQIDALKAAFAENSYGRGGHEMPLQIADEQDAVFAVTGDYYGARKEGVVVRNGQLYRDVMGDNVCILRRDGTLTVYQKGDISTLDCLDDSIWQAWAFGPVLVKDGTVCDTSGSKIKVRNPRCAIGYYAPGHYCFIVVDGRQKGYSEGMTLDELANTFAALGCEAAYNLDGGATAAMMFEGALVNQPTNGGRASSDIICF